MIKSKKVTDKMNELRMTKAQLIKSSGLTRVTIDKILKGGDVNVSTLEALANGLGVNVGFFFEELDEHSSISASQGSAVSVSGNITMGVNMSEHDELIRLREEVKQLKSQIKDKDARIEDLQRMNNFLMEKKMKRNCGFVG